MDSNYFCRAARRSGKLSSMEYEPRPGVCGARWQNINAIGKGGGQGTPSLHGWTSDRPALESTIRRGSPRCPELEVKVRCFSCSQQSSICCVDFCNESLGGLEGSADHERLDDVSEYRLIDSQCSENVFSSIPQSPLPRDLY